jgi:hypothetical protein
MKKMLFTWCALHLCLSIITATAEELVITSFDSSSTLVWSNNLSDGHFQVQWASELDGEWHSDFPYENLPNTNSVLSVKVPRFYRVVWRSGYTVSGAVYYSTNVLINEPVRLVPNSPEASPEQLTVTDQSGGFKFEGVKNGQYILWTTSHDGFNGIGILISVSASDAQKDLSALKRVYCLSPVRDAVISTNEMTFTWQTVPEASSHTFWLRTGNDDSYGSKFLTVKSLTTNLYQATLALTNGPYSWGVDLYDAIGKKVAFGNDFDFILAIE